MDLLPMTEAHLDQAAELERLCFPDPWSRALLAQTLALDNACTLAALEGDRLLGYASAQSVLDEGYLNNIAVRPDCRRRGVASGLMEALLAWGAEQGLAFLTLEVRPSNAAAYALYRKLGFDVVGVRPNYYAHPKENALLMTHYYDKENRP